jgi:hypothetical protein
MHRALPSSEYYGGSAPAPDRSADDVLSPHHRAGYAAGGQVRDGSRVHCDSLTEGGARLCPSGLAASTPQTFPAASQSPASRLLGVPHQVGARRSRPRSVRFEPVRALRGFMTPVPHVLLSGLLTGPTPSDGAGAPRLCQDCSHQPQRLPGASCPQLLPGRCDGPAVVVFHLHSNQQRLTAHETSPPGVHDLLRRPDPHPMKTATITYTDGRTLPFGRLTGVSAA